MAKSAPGTRLPDELRAALREAAFKCAQATGKEPAWGDLLLEAWRVAKGKVDGDAQPRSQGAPPARYATEIARLVDVLDLAPQVIKDALLANLEAFWSMGIPEPSRSHKGRLSRLSGQ